MRSMLAKAAHNAIGDLGNITDRPSFLWRLALNIQIDNVVLNRRFRWSDSVDLFFDNLFDLTNSHSPTLLTSLEGIQNRRSLVCCLVDLLLLQFRRTLVLFLLRCQCQAHHLGWRRYRGVENGFVSGDASVSSPPLPATTTTSGGDGVDCTGSVF